MHYLAIARLLALLTVANVAPLLAKRILGNRFAWPLDGNVLFLDGRPLFGRSKTVRGVAISLIATTACAPLLGVDWVLGVIVAAAAIAGDLFSSFVKRRIGLAPSAKATGLDQIPEALVPTLAVGPSFGLNTADILVTVAVFFVGEMLFARVFAALRLREHPY